MTTAEDTKTAAPTASGRPLRPADFANFAEALDYAATCDTGFTYYNARGEILDTLTYRRLRDEAR
ncbi:MAG: fatty acyl-AMP ligase, partial [Pseudomonadota bacterium]